MREKRVKNLFFVHFITLDAVKLLKFNSSLFLYWFIIVLSYSLWRGCETPLNMKLLTRLRSGEFLSEQYFFCWGCETPLNMKLLTRSRSGEFLSEQYFFCWGCETPLIMKLLVSLFITCTFVLLDDKEGLMEAMSQCSSFVVSGVGFVHQDC